MAADGYVLKVNKVEGNEYTVQGWSNHAWGEESKIEIKVLAGKGLVKIGCDQVAK